VRTTLVLVPVPVTVDSKAPVPVDSKVLVRGGSKVRAPVLVRALEQVPVQEAGESQGLQPAGVLVLVQASRKRPE
jgi:hypothetical protein